MIQKLPRSTPEAQGVESQGILTLVQSLQTDDFSYETHSLMILRHGHVICEAWFKPYKATLVHGTYSLSKSFTSTAIGMAVDEGLLSVEDVVLDYFQDEMPEVVSDRLKCLKIKHLLTMTDGMSRDMFNGDDVARTQDWPQLYLSIEMNHEPGEVFAYNTGATYMLSVILQKVSGMTLEAFLEPRLFQPLGFGKHFWITCPRGFSTGGFGLYVLTEDIAKFGQCYLQQGQWKGQTIIPPVWIAQATMKQVETGDEGDNDWSQGYGYQFWMGRHGTYRGDGAFGQFCIILPEQDMVVAMTAGHKDAHQLMNQVWACLLPAVKDQGPLKRGGNDRSNKQFLKNLQGPLVPSEHKVVVPSNTLTYRFNHEGLSFDQVTLQWHETGGTLSFKQGRHVMSTNFGYDGYQSGRMRYQWTPHLTMAQGVWQSAHKLVVLLRYVHTPHSEKYTFELVEEDLKMTIEENVSFEPDRLQVFVGHQVHHDLNGKEVKINEKKVIDEK